MAQLVQKANPNEQAWVTLATTDSYALGALVLGSSLTRAGTTRKKVVLVTSGDMSPGMIELLRNVFDEVVDVSLIDSKDAANLELLERPELGVTFTKLNCWKLTRFNKCVFLDADTLVLRNCDELFDKEEFSAAPDAGWPDCFNSGVFVFKPSDDTYDALIKHVQTQGSFDGGDQGLLNTFFSDWATKDIGKHLSFLYNMCATATYTYLPAYKFYGHNVRIIHFIGASKPWHVEFDKAGNPMPRYGEEHTVNHLKQWWQIFHADVKPILSQGLMKGLVSSSVRLPPDQSSPSAHHPQSTHGAGAHHSGAPCAGGAQRPEDKRESWEEGRPDYMGSASFDNILKKINTTMSSPEDSPMGSQADLSSSLPNLDQIVNYWHQQEDHHHEHHERPASVQEEPNYTPFLDETTQLEEEPKVDPVAENRAEWERGRPDYLGVNAFDNILHKLQEAMSHEWGGRGEWGHDYHHHEHHEEHHHGHHHHDHGHHHHDHGHHHEHHHHGHDSHHGHHEHHHHGHQEHHQHGHHHEHHHGHHEHHHHEHHHNEHHHEHHHHTPQNEDSGHWSHHQEEQQQHNEHEQQQEQSNWTELPMAPEQPQEQEQENEESKEEGAEEEEAVNEVEDVADISTAPRAPTPPLPDDSRDDWERNEPDYRGKASFDLILRRIEASTGKLRQPGEVTPSTVNKLSADVGSSTAEEKEVKPAREDVRDAATQTPTLASPYDPSLRQLRPICPSCGQLVSMQERESELTTPTTPTSGIIKRSSSKNKFPPFALSVNNRDL